MLCVLPLTSVKLVLSFFSFINSAHFTGQGIFYFIFKQTGAQRLSDLGVCVEFSVNQLGAQGDNKY